MKTTGLGLKTTRKVLLKCFETRRLIGGAWWIWKSGLCSGH